MPDRPRQLERSEVRSIFDNHGPDRAVADFLGARLARHPIVRIVSGYFYLSALGCIEESVKDWLALTDPTCSMRLLIGQETNRPTKEAILAALAGEYARAAAIPHGELLAELIERNRLEIAVYTLARLHGKVYLLLESPLRPDMAQFDVRGDAMWGSSNFTAPGIRGEGEGNLEFNALCREAGILRDIHDWFDIRWAEAITGADITAAVLRVAQTALARFAAEAPPGPTPFEAYLRALQEVQDLQALRAPADEVMAGLANFQRSAVTQALDILDRPDDPKHSTGFFVCDGTGLGKTHVAAGVMRHFLRKDWKILVLAPAASLKLNWRPFLAREGFSSRVVAESIQAFGDVNHPSPHLACADEYDLIVIDESHMLRNKGSTRYQQVQQLCRIPSQAGRRKRILLLTATPINNRIDDLVNQIGLFAGYGADPEGIVAETIQRTQQTYDLPGIFRDRERRNDAVPELLNKIMVRRERWAVQEHYVRLAPEEARLAGGKPLAFLEQAPPRALRYTLKDFEPELYTRIEAAFSGLHLPDIRVVNYLPRELITAELDGRSAGNEVLILQGLLKRLESSVHAFRISLERQIKFYEAFAQDLQNQKHIDRRGLLSRRLWQEDEEDEEIDDPPFDIAHYDTPGALADAQEDVEAFRMLLEVVVRLDRPQIDDKLSTLVQQLEGFAGNRKVLIFTEYVVTARYLFEQLQSRGNVALVTGKGGRHGDHPHTEFSIEAVVRAFAPRANPAPQGELFESTDPVRLLISTDVLAEGQNFQDCNIVINYDLTWNPVRIIQRVGRINRADSGAFHPPEDQRAHVLVFFPEEDLTQILNNCLSIVESNRRKLEQIAEIVGHATPIVFEDEYTTRILFDRLAHARSSSIYRDLEQQQAQAFGLGVAFDDDELLAQEYRRLAEQHPTVAESVRQMALPLITCRSSATGPPGLLALYRETAGESIRLRWLWYPSEGVASDITDRLKMQILKSLRCLPRTIRRPLMLDTDQVQSQLQTWLADDARRSEEARSMAMPGAAIAGKSSFTRLSELISDQVLRMPPDALNEPALRDQMTQVNNWLESCDQLVFNQRDAAAAAVDELLLRRLSARELLGETVQVSQRFPVVATTQTTVVPATWELIVAEEIRVDETR